MIQNSLDPMGRLGPLIFLATILSVICLSSKCHAADYHLVDLDYLQFRVAAFRENRDPLTPDYSGHAYTGRLALQHSLRILGAGYWTSDVHTEGVNSHVETIGWHTEVGLHLTSYLDGFYEHHSRHRMDSMGPDGNRDGSPDLYPVEDSYGVTLHLYTGMSHRRTLLGD